MEKIRTFIKGLDTLLDGGIPKDDLLLVSGMPGTGKSILGLQFIYNGATNGEPGAYISFEQNGEYLKEQAKGLGMDFGPLIAKNKVVLRHLDVRDLYKTLDDLKQIVDKIKAKRLVIDSISTFSVYATSYRNLPEDLITFLKETDHVPPISLGDNIQKQMVHTILDEIRKLGCTTILTSELSRESEWYSRDTISEFACDDIILLDFNILGEMNIVRTMSIVKSRRGKFKHGVYEFKIVSGKGVVL
jgi:KaiC/GvpD/RAD55 family RecA-like ATPase